MSRNLYKSGRVIVQGNSKCIDNNERVAKMLERITQSVAQDSSGETPEGFVQGLAMGDGLDSLLMDADGAESGNVIKAPSGPTEEEMRAKAQEILDQAAAEAEELKRQAIGEAKAESEALRQQAKNDGYRDGTEKAQKELAVAKEELRKKEIALEEDYQKKLEEMEPAIVDVLTEIYEHIFSVELQQYRQILIQLITSTMRKVEENKNFLVHVAKEDYAFVSMSKRSLQEASGGGRVNVEIVEDITLSRNQCMLETENGIFDCGLDTQLGELTRKLRLLSYERKSE